MVDAISTLSRDIDEILPGVIADRRHLHQHPELSGEEYETAKFVAERLESLGVEGIRTGISGTGVTGLVRGTAEGPQRVVLLRADMDALPIEEESDVPYCSTVPGVMHACGHDAHVSALLAATRLLMARRDAFSGTVKVLFQPSEESMPSGAGVMIEEGVLEDPHVDAVFGLHIWQEDDLGTVRVRPGPMMASADGFEVRVQGKGGHGALPHTTVDPIVATTNIVGALQTIIARELDPTSMGVVSVCKIHAGHALNVIPDTCEFGGNIRAFDPDERAMLVRRMQEITRSVAEAHGCTVEIDILQGVPAVINDPGMAAVVADVAAEVVGPEKVSAEGPAMPSEDFSLFLEERPGCYFFVGSRNPEKGYIWGHHHPRFDIDENSIPTAIAMLTRTALAYLNGTEAHVIWTHSQGDHTQW